MAGGAAVVVVRGPAGVGKSALVSAFCAQYEGSCLWVDLPAGHEPSELRRALDARPPKIVVLDGVGGEPMIRAFADFLATTPSRPTLLVTCRRFVGTASDARLDLGPLAMPSSPHELERFPASRLWLELMMRISAGRTLSACEAKDLVAIVTALDGVPAAIELGVRRERLMGMSALRARLEATGAARTLGLVERAFEPAWSALAEPQRRALFDLTVFRGAFSLELAEAVLGAREPSVSQLVEGLIDASCVRVETSSGGLPMLRVARLVRDEVAQRLGAASAEVRRAHAFATLESCAAITRGPRRGAGVGGSARQALERHAAELEATFEWGLEGDSLAIAARALVLLDRVRWVGGSTAPHLARIARLLPRVAELEPSLAAQVSEMNARWQTRRGEPPSSALEAALALACEASSPVLLVQALRTKALALSRLGRPEQALHTVEEAIARTDEVEGSLGAQALTGQRPKSQSLRGQSLRAQCLRTQAGLLRHAGHSERAHATYRLALDAYTQLEDDEGRGATLAECAMLLLEMGRRAEAELATERARLLLERQPQSYLSATLDAVWAMQAHVDGDLDRAVELHQRATGVAALCGDVALTRVSRGYEVLARFERGDAIAPEVLDVLEALRRTPAECIGVTLEALFAFLLATAGSVELAARQLERAKEVELPPSNFRHAVEFLALATTLAIERTQGRAPQSCYERAQALLATGRPTGSRAGDGTAEALSDVRLAARLVRDWSEDLVERPLVLQVASDGSRAWTARHGEVDLRSRRLLGRLLLRLAEASEQAVRCVPREQLLAAGWPGESMVESSASRRLQVSISRLRHSGLRDVLETLEGGYAIADGWAVEIVPARRARATPGRD